MTLDLSSLPISGFFRFSWLPFPSSRLKLDASTSDFSSWCFSFDDTTEVFFGFPRFGATLVGFFG
jgi:hypothetical protein